MHDQNVHEFQSQQYPDIPPVGSPESITEMFDVTRIDATHNERDLPTAEELTRQMQAYTDNVISLRRAHLEEQRKAA